MGALRAAVLLAAIVALRLALAASAHSSSAAVPQHIKTWEFWDSHTDNEGLPVAFVAKHAEFIELANNENTNRHVAEFIAAGGKYAIFYSDPHLVPDCKPPFTIPAGECDGPLGDTKPESAWLHGADGSRLHGTWGPKQVIQDALNPGSPATQAAYHRYTERRVAGTAFNAFELDDTDAAYSLAYFHWKFHTAEGRGAIEYDRLRDPESAWLAAQRALATNAARPVFFNGTSWNPGADRVLFRSKNSLGAIAEDAFSTPDFRVNDADGSIHNRWAAEQNKILNVIAARRFINVIDLQSNMNDPIGDRIYSLASIWLSYDPNYTIAENQISTSTRTAHGFPVTFVPEFDIVPTAPLKTATIDIAVLRAPTGLYVREFAHCFQAERPIGACAAVVNPSKTTARPLSEARLRRRYGRSLALDAASSYAGGRARWIPRVQRTIAPVSAVILAR